MRLTQGEFLAYLLRYEPQIPADEVMRAWRAFEQVQCA